MHYNNAADWLMTHSDVPIRFRIAREILHDNTLERLLQRELLNLKSVQTILYNLRGEDVRGHAMPEHGAENIFYENAILIASNYGLHGGMSELCDAVSYYIQKLHKLNSVDSYFGQTESTTICYRKGQHFPAILIANLAAWAGINDDAVTSFLKRSLDEMYQFTVLDKIYQGAEEASRH